MLLFNFNQDQAMMRDLMAVSRQGRQRQGNVSNSVLLLKMIGKMKNKNTESKNTKRKKILSRRNVSK